MAGYLYFELGYQSQGSIAVVTLRGTEANVQLLDSANYQNYKAGRQFRYYGGHYKQSPARISIPHSGMWYVVVDMGGYAGRVNADVKVIPR